MPRYAVLADNARSVTICTNAEIAQLVERFPEEEDVPSSSLGLGTLEIYCLALAWVGSEGVLVIKSLMVWTLLLVLSITFISGSIYGWRKKYVPKAVPTMISQ